MGSVDKYCPHCGSTKIFVMEIELEMEDSNIQLDGEILYYECGDCHSTWEPHTTDYTTFGRA